MAAHPSFEFVSHLLLLEEPTPSEDALRRWQERYPQYRDSLADFFKTWSRQEAMPQDPAPEIDEDSLVEKGVAHAIGILRLQGRVIPKDSVVTLQPFDQLVMAAVFQLRGAGYNASITRRVSEMSGRNVLLASTFASLRRLEHWKLVESRYADPEAEPQNKGTRYFMATMAGERALAHAKAAEAEGFWEDYA
jgi:hypothetical protein